MNRNLNNFNYIFLLQPGLLATKYLILTILVFLLFSCSSNNSVSQPEPVALEAAAAMAAESESESESENTAAAPDAVPGMASAATTVCDAASQQLSESLLQLVNQARATARTCGNSQFAAASALTLNTQLNSAAKVHSDDMATANFFSHQGSDGLQVWDRAEALGYLYGSISENIAAGQETTDDVHIGWLDSPSHCANLMDPDVTDFGAACSTNPETDLKRYWTTVFGRLR